MNDVDCGTSGHRFIECECDKCWRGTPEEYCAFCFLRRQEYAPKLPGDMK